MSVPRTMVLACLALVLSAAPGAPGAAIDRDDEPVIVTGATVPDFLGEPIADLFVFRYDTGLGDFEPVPFQIDERVDHVFNPDTVGEFVENIYDLFGEDDGLLDGDDEIAFLFRDGGPQAPSGAAWPAGAGAERYEIAVSDPRAGAPVPTRWFYLFRGTGLPVSADDYVSWVVGEATDIQTNRMELEFVGKWLLTGFRVFPSCGSGADLIDRLKGRAIPFGTNEEDEERWDDGSTFLGGMEGPVRAIRYVRGAASGLNTIHHDVVYEAYWRRVMNLRVHPVDEVSLYFDWLPTPPQTFYSPDVPGGVPVDGVPDAVGTTVDPWNLMRTSGGGLTVLWDMPPSPLYATKSFLYRDDASYDDEIPSNPGYSDDDDSAYGVHGLRLLDLLDSNIDPIFMQMTVFPLCSNVGDATLGADYRELLDVPLQIANVPQWETAGPVRTLGLERDGDDVVLQWSAVPDATSYRVYTSQFPDLPRASWTLAADSSSTSFRDEDALLSSDDRYYSVVTVTPAGEGPW